jgi:hypothetical protein
MTPEEYSKLPSALQNALRDVGFSPNMLDTRTKIRGEKPYTQVGAASLKGEAVAPDLDKDTYAATVAMPDKVSSDSYVTYNPSGPNPSLTRAHEMEHVLANQGLGKAARINSLWDELAGAKNNPEVDRGSVVERLVAHAPYLAKNWGLDADTVNTGYFSKHVLGRRDTNNYLYEQLATLSALEQAKNKRLTDDPYIRKHILKTPAERETYNAVTGLRQTRLDAKDLPPYTRQPEKYAKGGSVAKAVPEAYRSKLI